MSRAAARTSSAEPDLLRLAAEAEDAVGALLTDAANAVTGRVSANGALSAELLEREQRAAHGLAWLATYVEAVRQLAAYAARMTEAGRFGDLGGMIGRIRLREYIAQIAGGIPMSQGEILRLSDLGLMTGEIAVRWSPALDLLMASGNTVD